MLLFNFLFSFVALASESLSTETLTTERVQLEESPRSFNNWQYDVRAELSFENKISQVNLRSQARAPQLQNFALGIDFQHKEDWNFVVELLGEQNYQDTNVYLGEIYLAWVGLNNFKMQVGQMYYNYGLLTGLEGLLSQRPTYYTDLLVSRRGIDLGAQIAVQPLSQLPLFLSYSYYAGRSYRSGDGKTEVPQQAPQVLQIRYEPSFLKAEVTYLTQEYYHRPKLNAVGLSVSGTPLFFYGDKVFWQPEVEVWSLDYKGIVSQERKGLARLMGQNFEAYGFFYRWLQAKEEWTSSGTSISQVFALHGLGYRFNRYIHFEYQNIRNQERQSGFTADLVREDVYRIFMNF